MADEEAVGVLQGLDVELDGARVAASDLTGAKLAQICKLYFKKGYPDILIAIATQKACLP